MNAMLSLPTKKQERRRMPCHHARWKEYNNKTSTQPSHAFSYLTEWLGCVLIGWAAVCARDREEQRISIDRIRGRSNK